MFRVLIVKHRYHPTDGHDWLRDEDVLNQAEREGWESLAAMEVLADQTVYVMQRPGLAPQPEPESAEASNSIRTRHLTVVGRKDLSDAEAA